MALCRMADMLSTTTFGQSEQDGSYCKTLAMTRGNCEARCAKDFILSVYWVYSCNYGDKHITLCVPITDPGLYM